VKIVKVIQVIVFTFLSVWLVSLSCSPATEVNHGTCKENAVCEPSSDESHSDGATLETSGPETSNPDPSSPDTPVSDTSTPDASVSDASVSEQGADKGVPKITGKFSFFVTSLEAMQKLSGSKDGFGGNLGGLKGADSICQRIAEGVGAGHKTWRAFLSVTKGPDGKPVHAIDRIGKGPWYDRNERLVSKDLQGLVTVRPQADSQIANDLPNEHGQGQKQFGDNHDTLTGSNKEGRLNSTDPASTCHDWTSSDPKGTERKVMAGHSWPSTRTPGWIQGHPVPGCAAGVELRQTGSGRGTNFVGGAGGYGGIYCFALTP